MEKYLHLEKELAELEEELEEGLKIDYYEKK